MTIKILLADDQALFREGLRMVLATQPDFEVVGEATNGAEALQLAAMLHPDIILMDMRMPVLGGVEATRRLRATQPECRVIVLTTFDEDELLFDGLRAGAVGYLLKAVSSPRLLEAIRTVARGDSILDPAITNKVVTELTRLSHPLPAPQLLAEPISEREIEVLRLLAAGASNQEIADQLIVALNTVKRHVSNIMGKLGAENRTQAVIKARQLGLL
ncbi:MAG: response regulator transcription factor [Caldilineaceae bacterium]